MRDAGRPVPGKIEVEIAPAPVPSNPAGPAAGTPAATGSSAHNSIDAPVVFPVPKGVPGEVASRVATELAKAAGLTGWAAWYEDTKTLYLSGPAADVEKVRKSLPAVLEAVKGNAK